MAIAIILLGLTGVLSAAAAGITDVSPTEGTVGTGVTLSGSGFGERTGAVELGGERCQVSAWSDSRIACTVSRPLPAGVYTFTVVPPGDRKSQAPMTSPDFTVRAPEIAPGELSRDGDTVTITGAFFGDRTGEVLLAYRDNGVVVDRAKVADWTMDAIRIQLPADLAGQFVVKVQNEVGRDFALFSLGDGPPTLVGMDWPSGYGQIESEKNARGIYYNGRLWVWSTYYTSDTFVQMFHPKYLHRIEYRTFQNGQLSGAHNLWDGRSEAELAPVVVQYPNNGPQKMFTFATGRDGNCPVRLLTSGIRRLRRPGLPLLLRNPEVFLLEPAGQPKDRQ
jgi:hypothetical protein